jgi:small-conductance mechanosensitive channel
MGPTGKLTLPLIDIGDKVQVEDTVMVVSEMDLLTTIFYRVDGQGKRLVCPKSPMPFPAHHWGVFFLHFWLLIRTEVYIPNYVLAGKSIYNIKRSPHQSDAIAIIIDGNTSDSQIIELRGVLQTFAAQNPRDYHNNLDITLSDLDCTANTLKMNVSVKHKANWQDGSKKVARHNKVGGFSHNDTMARVQKRVGEGPPKEDMPSLFFSFLQGWSQRASSPLIFLLFLFHFPLSLRIAHA